MKSTTWQESEQKHSSFYFPGDHGQGYLLGESNFLTNPGQLVYRNDSITHVCAWLQVLSMEEVAKHNTKVTGE